MKILTLLLCLILIGGIVNSASEKYTSLVIDARGLELERSMSPKILSEKGYEVYGTIFKNLDKALKIGVVFYSPDLKIAKKYAPKRIGKNPLIIKGIKVRGLTNSYVVISDKDARKVLKNNKKQKFLEKFKVIILK